MDILAASRLYALMDERRRLDKRRREDEELNDANAEFTAVRKALVEALQAANTSCIQLTEPEEDEKPTFFRLKTTRKYNLKPELVLAALRRFGAADAEGGAVAAMPPPKKAKKARRPSADAALAPADEDLLDQFIASLKAETAVETPSLTVGTARERGAAEEDMQWPSAECEGLYQRWSAGRARLATLRKPYSGRYQIHREIGALEGDMLQLDAFRDMRVDVDEEVFVIAGEDASGSDSDTSGDDDDGDGDGDAKPEAKAPGDVKPEALGDSASASPGGRRDDVLVAVRRVRRRVPAPALAIVALGKQLRDIATASAPPPAPNAGGGPPAPFLRRHWDAFVAAVAAWLEERMAPTVTDGFIAFNVADKVGEDIPEWMRAAAEEDGEFEDE